MGKLLLIFCLLLQNISGKAAHTDTLTLREEQSPMLTNNYFSELEDPYEELTIRDILTRGADFHTIKQSLPVLHYTKSTTWLKFVLRNDTKQPSVPISIFSSVIDEFDMYYVNEYTGKVDHISGGSQLSQFSSFKQTGTVINGYLQPGTTHTVYLRIKSHASAVVPIHINSFSAYLDTADHEVIVMTGFLAIMITMALYNLMLFITVRDRSYLYYVFYIILLSISQSLLRGFGAGMITNNKVVLNTYIIPANRILFGYSILLFVGEFLQLKQNLRRYHRYYYLLYALYTLPLLMMLIGDTTAAYNLISFASLTVSSILLLTGLILYIRGFKPAKFFMIGWSFFLTAIVITVIRNRGYIPYNDFTSNLVLYSSILEVVLFSVALADKINFYRRQNHESQQLALTIAKANEQLITQQNIVLENQVKARTEQLLSTNQSLQGTIENLQLAQKKLINTEKMASLGVLTAGVAHEINNPINFVSSSIGPLRTDFDEIFTLLDKYRQTEGTATRAELLEQAKTYREHIDLDFLREEIDSLFSGIEEGAARTAEIVQSLRAFSRTDELILKPLDINKAILNTLIILRSSIPYTIEIKPLLDKLEPMMCYPGKINQVLMNLVNNSIQAINAKPEHGQESILINTIDLGTKVMIEITDTGTGMTEAVKQRIFEPFFTTKTVGEGTGLGLSIVFGIIEQHHGVIEAQSAPGVGSTFRVTLPKNLQELLNG